MPQASPATAPFEPPSVRRRRREHPRIPDAQLGAGLRLLELPSAHDLHHAQREFAIAEAVGGGADDVAVRSDVEARNELALQRLPFLKSLLVAVANLASVVADVLADESTFLAGWSGRSRLVA